MNISLTHSDLHPQKTAKRLPGETHAFVPKKGSFRNLVPPQHLVGGSIVSERDHEVRLKHEAEYIDPLIQRINGLETENKRLRAACHLIHQRHACASGSLEMSEIDEELGKLGLEVWTWSHT